MANRNYIFNSDALRQLRSKKLDTYFANNRNAYRAMAKEIYDALKAEANDSIPLRGDVFGILCARLEASRIFNDELLKHNVNLNVSYSKWFAFFSGLIIDQDWAYISGQASSAGQGGAS